MATLKPLPTLAEHVLVAGTRTPWKATVVVTAGADAHLVLMRADG
jgi:hypothetical protein